MTKLEYSAGAVSKGFWFQAFKKYNELLSDGLSDKEIKVKQEEENIVLAPSENYGKKIINEVSKRTRALPVSIKEMFISLGLSDQKLVNTLGIMLTDRFFFEFMYELYREKLITGYTDLDLSDLRIFLNNKSEQSKKVNSFKDYTKKRLGGAYLTYLKEAGLAEEKGNNLRIIRPILDIDLENQMKNQDLNPYLKIFLGE